MSSSQLDLPWYKDRTAPSPFSLAKKIYVGELQHLKDIRLLNHNPVDVHQSNNPVTAPFRTIAFFPWTNESLKTLWNGSSPTPDAPNTLSQWQTIISDWSDAVAVGGHSCVYVFFTERPQAPMRINLPQNETTLKSLPTDVINIAWTIRPGPPPEPLLIFSHLNLLYIYNVKEKGVSSYLRGHGGAITSIAVHPILTNIFCTTSRDYSVRIYDLNLTPQNTWVNPPWPPATESSLGGAAHGLHMSEAEGTGIGQCIVVLMGGRSGGHQAAVLGAAFHPQLPLIATCGLDRLVKIWFVPLTSNKMISREDKPLFSSSKIHKARILNVSWLSHDMLLTHSAPALMKTPNNQEPRQTYVEAGQITVWRWLGIERFFPSGDHRQTVLRGCASDYQESASFKIISTMSLPKEDVQAPTPILHLYQSSTHDPIVLFTYPNSSYISMFNVIHLQPRKPLPFPLDQMDLVESTQRMHVTGRQDPEVYPESSMWTLRTGTNSVPQHESSENLMACAMGKGGTAIIGVGAKGTLWIWKARHRQTT